MDLSSFLAGGKGVGWRVPEKSKCSWGLWGCELGRLPRREKGQRAQGGQSRDEKELCVSAERVPDQKGECESHSEEKSWDCSVLGLGRSLGKAAGGA